MRFKGWIRCWWAVLLLSVIVLVGAYLRLADLGFASMGADRMELYKIAQAGIKPLELVLNSEAHLGSLNPFWFAVHNGFLQAFRLDVTFTTMRLPDAITGIMVILAMYGLGFRFGGRLFGLLAAFIVALHPFSILMSRECYFYVPVVLGCTLSIWSILCLVDCLEKKSTPGLLFFLAAFSGLILTTYATQAGWIFAGITGLVMYGLLLRPAFKREVKWRVMGVLTAGFFLFGLPMLVCKSWGIAAALSMFSGDAAEHWGTIFGKKQLGDVLVDFSAVLKGYLFGRGGGRGLANVLILLLAGCNFASSWKSSSKERVFLVYFTVVFGMLLLAHAKSVHPVNPRHFSPFLPFLVVLICMGFRQAVSLAQRLAGSDRGWVSNGVWAVCAALVVLAFGRPAMWAMKDEGGPPYMRVSEWVDANLVPGTIVLCDSWLAPWNQLRVNPAANVSYTFTVPSEPPAAYVENKWRETAVQHLDADPFAAYLDQKQYWKLFGQWQEPYKRFSRRHEIVDHANFRLYQIGLAYHGPLDLKTPIAMQTMTIFYNTDEDVISRAKDAGKRVLRGYGEGWRYLKPWQPMQGWPEQLMQALWVQAGMYGDGGKTLASLDDLQKMPQQQANGYLNQGRWADYRIPGARSALRLFNLTEQELPATLTLTGIALSGNVRCMIGDQMVVFPQTLMVERRVPVTLKPGENQVVVALPMNQFLLVHDVRLTANDVP